MADKGENMADKGENMTATKRIRYVVAGAAGILAAWILFSAITGVGWIALSGSCSGIPTCEGCTLTIESGTFGTASGNFGPYECSYEKAAMIVSRGWFTSAEVPVGVPAPSAPYSAGVPLTFTPTSARMCMYFRYGIFGIWRCHSVPFSVR